MLPLQMPVLAVNRERVFRLHQRVDHLDLLLAGVSGHMRVLEDDLRALHTQLVDDLGHRLLVARDRVGGEHDYIPRIDLYLAVQVCRHAGERRHRLTLGTGRDQHDLPRAVIDHLLGLNQNAVRNPQISELLRDINDVDHAASFHADLAVILHRRVDDLLHAVHIAGKCSYNQPVLLILGEDLLKYPSDRLLRARESRAQHIGRVAQQSQNALMAELTEALQIDRIAVNRRKVHLEVTRVHNDTRRA